MLRTALPFIAALAVIGPDMALAQNGNGNGNGKANNAQGNNGFCPPGLANREPACVPPGQARQFERGDRLDGDYILIRNPSSYGLRDDRSYYRQGDYVYNVDPDTREVLAVIGLISQILN
ncbi:MAG: hypothetical protein ACSHWY_04825 [Octadecabacter sp.]